MNATGRSYLTFYGHISSSRNLGSSYCRTPLDQKCAKHLTIPLGHSVPHTELLDRLRCVRAIHYQSRKLCCMKKRRDYHQIAGNSLESSPNSTKPTICTIGRARNRSSGNTARTFRGRERENLGTPRTPRSYIRFRSTQLAKIAKGRLVDGCLCRIPGWRRQGYARLSATQIRLGSKSCPKVHMHSQNKLFILRIWLKFPGRGRKISIRSDLR